MQVAATDGKRSVFLAVVRRSGPNLVEASLIPTALFYAALVGIGMGAALASAMLWTSFAIGRRVVRRRPISPLLLLGAVGVTLKTSVAVLSGSTFLYFAQPVANSVVMAGLFAGSALLGKPMIERLALEFWELTPEVLARPAVSRLLRSLTFLWAAINLASGIVTLSLLLSLPTATYVATKQLASLAITALGIAITVDASLRTARREGLLPQPDAVAPLAPLAPLPPLVSLAVVATD